jgi:catechol 2,3-dioxygenase-like lactoylglutathione lyase family enzyme
MKDIVTGLVNQFETGKMSRRQLIEGLTIAATTAVAAPGVASAAAPAGKGFKATSINHLSFGVPDYAKARDFYVDLLGFEVKKDDGKQCYMICGESSIVTRKTHAADGKTYIDHVCYTIANWDGKAVEAELKRRGLDPKPGANEFSYIVKDPNGFGLQIAGHPHCCEA